MSDFIGWIQLAGKRVLVERLREEPRYQVVRLCDAWGGFARGRELRVPRSSFETAYAPASGTPGDNGSGREAAGPRSTE